MSGADVLNVHRPGRYLAHPGSPGVCAFRGLVLFPALKEIVRRQIGKSVSFGIGDALMYELNTRIDRLTMIAFDLYMSCRETLWQQKANQLYSRTHKLLEKANLLKDADVAG
jgi:hypothetical protein